MNPGAMTCKFIWHRRTFYNQATTAVVQITWLQMIEVDNWLTYLTNNLNNL